ncbi:MAG: Asp-tRNA(Asn)/Glu-tRNA(Gln) amidotransferase subunit GatB [Candidatus Latescibacterota bacterium]|nr:Asp-tRNA(Asn)/Glu-tRNA(Gln) amidotransferase subunit GatB [Candidatus Latescibacterota bacterium]
MSTYETVIGMEVHVELQTHSKMFCSCPADHFHKDPNAHTCPVCTAQPGALPIINERAMQLTAMTGLALNCEVQPHNVFARKNYVYPDLPKGYQISQYDLPLCENGYIDIITSDGKKHIGIERVHLEEDTGKLIHSGRSSLVDYNRAGVPLMEIVTDSSIRSADEAFAYLTKIRQVVRYLEASSGDMEKGAMRCEANISIRPFGSEKYGTKVEVKNLNSFRAVRNAIDYEVKRQQQVVEEGNQVRQVTMGWDEEAGVTREQRSKETSEDYRYFPEPDLLNIQLQEDWINRLKDGLPELPTVKADRFSSEYGLNTQDISVITEDRSISDYFEAVLTFDNIEPKQAANWVLGEVFRLLNEETQDGHITVTPKDLAKIISLVSKGTINQNAARTVFSEMWEHGGDPEDIIKSKGLGQISDTNELDQAVAQVIANEPEAAAKIQNGNLKPIQFLMGQVMKATRGKANPRLVQELIKQQLEK